MRPAGLSLAGGATLRFASRVRPLARSVLRWRAGAGRFPIPTSLDEDALHAATFTLGYAVDATPAAVPSRSVAHALGVDEPSTELDVASLDCDFELSALLLQLAGATDEDDIARAQADFDRLQAVVDACMLREVAELAGEACAAYQSAALTAQAVQRHRLALAARARPRRGRGRHGARR